MKILTSIIVASAALAVTEAVHAQTATMTFTENSATSLTVSLPGYTVGAWNHYGTLDGGDGFDYSLGHYAQGALLATIIAPDPLNAGDYVLFGGGTGGNNPQPDISYIEGLTLSQAEAQATIWGGSYYLASSDTIAFSDGGEVTYKTGGGGIDVNVDIVATPEPAPSALAVAGGAVLLLFRRRK